MMLAAQQSSAEISTGRPTHGLAGGYARATAPVVLMMLGCYIVLKPYYILPSGLPQIGDMILITALPFVLLLPQPRWSEHATAFRFCLIVFCSYAALVNLGWTFALMDPRMALSATHYLFNLCLVIICLRIGVLHPRATLLTIAYAIALSAAIQAASAAFTYDAARLRQIASFNNPNQLGYWSLLSICIFWSISGRAKVKWYVQAPIAACLFYLAALSLSKSTIIAAVLLCGLHFIRKPKLILAGLILIVPIYLVIESSDLFERVSGRLLDIGEQSDDNLQARGFPRIMEYPEYLLTGAGEGALYRFDHAVDDGEQIHEIHSTFLTIVFSYGLVGSVAFAAAIWRLYRLSSGGAFLYLIPPFLYGLTHQGLRFSFFWLLLAVIAVLGSIASRDAVAAGTRARKNLQGL
jgi:hypothetical protein